MDMDSTGRLLCVWRVMGESGYEVSFHGLLLGPHRIDRLRLIPLDPIVGDPTTLFLRIRTCFVLYTGDIGGQDSNTINQSINKVLDCTVSNLFQIYVSTLVKLPSSSNFVPSYHPAIQIEASAQI